ncbi:MAG: alpha/beta fold hydrolase [Patescibacteria group bacterium]|nr:alpha/beta fold hydrolase [Patescibacteria group bacterium]
MTASIKLKPCFLIDIVTPKKFKLSGLWFGPAKPKRAIIFVHGLSSSAFQTALAEALVDKETAVITFSNRGHNKIAKIYRLDNTTKGYHSVLAGQAHEVFTDCVDDIWGVVNFVQNAGVRDVYLAGHSTGCQKSIYYVSRKGNQKNVKGVILLAPLSDYAAALKFDTGGKLAKATKVAQDFVRKGKKHELLPESVAPNPIDAQRFLSLYTPDSIEEIFSYVQPKKNPRLFKSIEIPVLVLLAGDDEYGDRPAKDIAAWFEKNTRSKHFVAKVISGAMHGFTGKEKVVVGAVRDWLKR